MWRVYVPTKLRKDLRRRFPVSAREAINAALRTLERDGTHAAGVDITKVQDLLGHRHITTTQIYDKRRRTTSESASHDVPI